MSESPSSSTVSPHSNFRFICEPGRSDIVDSEKLLCLSRSFAFFREEIDIGLELSECLGEDVNQRDLCFVCD